MCVSIGCKTSKSFNFNGLKAEYCSSHKLDGMINTKHEICDSCNKQASYGFLFNNLRIKCGEHKTDNMINLKTKNIKCLDLMCSNNIEKIDGYCSIGCKLSNTLHENTTNEDLSNVSYKEYLIFRFLQNNFTNKIYWNKQIKGTNRRPDFRIDFGNFQILIENDEDQHKNYDKNAEIERLEDIYKCLNIPLYVIRFNPDKYINNDIVVESCFKNNKVHNDTEWANRLTTLKNTIESCIHNILGQSVLNKYETIYLFYDI